MASVKRNFFYSSILTTANYIFPLLTYPYMSRVLGVDKIGICNFVDSIITYFVIFSMMGTSILGIRAIAQNKDNKEALNKAFNSVFFLNTISTGIMLIALILFYLLTPKMHAYTNMMFLGGFKLVFNYLLIEWFYRGLEKFGYITGRTLLIKTIYVISVFLLVRNENDYVIYYCLTVLMIVVNAIVNVVNSIKYIRFSIHEIELSKYIRPYFILGLDLLFGSMYTTFNVAFLGFMTSDTQVGYYTTATKLYQICLALFSAFTGVMIPRMSALYVDGKYDLFINMLKKSYRILFVFSIPVIFFIVINASQVIWVVSGEGYEGAIIPMKIVIPLMCILGYKQVIILQGFLPLGKNKAILLNSIAGASVSIIANVLLVPHFQAIGSAIVWVLAEFAGLCCSQYLIKKYINLDFPWRIMLKYLVLNIPLGIVLWLCSVSIADTWYELITAGGIFLIYFIILNALILKDEIIIGLLKKVKLYVS